MLNNYQKVGKMNSGTNKRNRVINIAKAYNMSRFDSSKISNSIDARLDQISARNSSRNNNKSGAKRGLILPNLSKKPSVYEDPIKSVDLKHSNYKDRSLNRVPRRGNNQTKKIKMTSLRGSPSKNKLPDYSISHKLEKLMNNNVCLL